MNKYLSVKNISKSFGNRLIIEDISLQVNSYDIYGLIALNGVGKTSLIKIILNLIHKDQGEVTLFGETKKISEVRKYIGYLPEKFTPSPYLKGREFLNIYLNAYGQKYEHSIAQELSINLDFDVKALDVVIKKYSKGMGQKLGLIALFMQNPKLMILDEPMSGLDPKARVCLKFLMRDYVSKGGAIFFSSHILADIDEISTEIGVISDRKLIFSGKPEEFRNTYPGVNLENSFIKAITPPDDHLQYI